MKFDINNPILRHPPSIRLFEEPVPVEHRLIQKYIDIGNNAAEKIHQKSRNDNRTDLSNGRIKPEDEADGYHGEISFSQYIKLPFNLEPDQLKNPDVGPHQVRTTRHPQGCLILREHDNMNCLYILVNAIKSPIFRIMGFIHPLDAIRKNADGEYVFKTEVDILPFGEKRIRWYIPADRLMDIRILKRFTYD